MEKTRHTPGPWEVRANPRSVRVGTGAAIICKNTHRGSLTDEEAIANARLVSAAPDLLAALEAVQHWMKYNTPCPLSQIQNAIDKAKGEFTCQGCGRPEEECSETPCADVVADREASYDPQEEAKDLAFQAIKALGDSEILSEEEISMTIHSLSHRFETLFPNFEPHPMEV